MVTRDELVRAAARENAQWCEVMCRTHGTVGEFEAAVWSSARRTPPLYPDAVTLRPEATAAEVLARIDRESPGASVKDSFGCLDLSEAGFGVLFEAHWIHRPASRPRPATVRPWVRIGDAELSGWVAAWSGGELPGWVFRPELLAAESVSLLGCREHGRFVAGAVVHRAGPLVGVSNLFYAGIPAEDAWSGCLNAIARWWPGHAVVGYEQGDDLAAAVGHGFDPIGVVRVWTDVARAGANAHDRG
ncbi:hypothetical protein D5S18_05990 [Nocardia panacis]|uniref:Uncharacterized protein n=1 Tax=Nocardia panacis TaxID=2340916 RepID=A0A3A4KGJ0_9NOCA|nr:hypothetical protein [Nocardia panacis]RJO78434.1 hypothetical protein D5S18_05990 [Nocardia panacis]